ncbi:MAG: ClpXP protease specificity-enhancing factor [Rubrivivax sp.]
MNGPLAPDGQGSSTRPYLIRALHDWCTDNGLTPYLAVQVDESVQVPGEYVKNGEIVLNVGFEATSGLKLGNEFIEFKARFGGVARDIVVPVDHVVAIYARENGQGMAFPPPAASREGEAGAQRGGALQPAAASPTPVSTPAGPATARPPSATTLRLASADAPSGSEPSPPEPSSPPPGGPGGSRPSLKRVK